MERGSPLSRDEYAAMLSDSVDYGSFARSKGKGKGKGTSDDSSTSTSASTSRNQSGTQTPATSVYNDSSKKSSRNKKLVVDDSEEEEQDDDDESGDSIDGSSWRAQRSNGKRTAAKAQAPCVSRPRSSLSALLC